ncbi:MAG: hypothetical protein R2939_05045 [Kofleriaceae bacterium]
MWKNVSILSATLLSAAVACGDSSTGNTCGEGTIEQDGECVAEPIACGAGTVQVGDECVPEDLMTPGRVTGLTATVAGSDVTLAWTKGAGATSTTIVRLSGATGTLQAGRTYAVGDEIDGVGTVIAVTDGASPSHTRRASTPRRHRPHWRLRRRRLRERAGGAARAGTTFTFNAGLTVTTSGPVTITAAAVAGSTNEFDLTITNTSRGPLRNLAMRVTTETGVALDSVTDYTFDGLYDYVEATYDRIDRSEGSFISLVPGYLYPGQTAVRRLSANVGIPLGGGGPLSGTATVTLGQGAGAISGHAMMDLSTGSSKLLPRGTGAKPIAMSTGFAWNGLLLTGTRQRGELRTFDPATGRVDVVATLREGHASVPCLGEAGGAVWAVSKAGHASSDAIGVRVHKLDPVTLAEVDVTEIPDIELDYRGRCAFDGNYLMLSERHVDQVFDLTTGQFVDEDPGTVEYEPFFDEGDQVRGYNRLVDDGWLYSYNRATRELSRENLTTRVVEPLHTFGAIGLHHGPYKLGDRFVIVGQTRESFGEWDGTTATEYTVAGNASRGNKPGFTIGDSQYWFERPNAMIVDRSDPESPTRQQLSDPYSEGPGWALLFPDTTTLFE